MPLTAARLVLGFAFMPERAWASVRDGARFSVLAYFGTLALLPACVAALLAASDTHPGAGWLSPLAPGSPFALALHDGLAALPLAVTPDAAPLTLARTAGGATLAYGATWLAALSGAWVLNLLLPFFCTRRNYGRCLLLVACAATPLLLSSVALLHPSLVPVIALAAMHSFYVAYLGLPVLLGMPRSEAGVCLGVTTIAALVLGQIAGYGAGLLVSAVTP